MKRWRQRKEENLDAEIRNHLDEAIRDRIERGETLDEARVNALREFGNEPPRVSRRQFSLSQAATADSSCWR